MGDSAGKLSTEQVQEIYTSAIVIDGSIAPRMDEAQLRRMKESGITAFNWTVCSPGDDLATALLKIADGLEFIAAHPSDLCLVLTGGDIETAKVQGKVGLIFGPQNARLAEGDLRYFRVLHQLGVRILQLTYNERNAYGDGATEPSNAGLSEAGREAIAEINRLRILLDLSHCGARTTREAIDASADPVAITHSNSSTVFPSLRNKTDETVKALAERGGVLGLTLWSPMVGSPHGGQPTVDDFLRHVAYLANLVGPEHLAIGTDHSEGKERGYWDARFSSTGKYRAVTGNVGGWYNYDTRFVLNGRSCVDLPCIVQKMAGLGFTESELRGILGDNSLRLFRQVWGS